MPQNVFFGCVCFCAGLPVDRESSPGQKRLRGRNDLLEEIHRQFLNGERVLFLGGLEVSARVSLQNSTPFPHTDLYDRILFVTYVDSLQNLVCDSSQIEIDPLERRDEETDEEFFQRKDADFPVIDG